MDHRRKCGQGLWNGRGLNSLMPSPTLLFLLLWITINVGFPPSLQTWNAERDCGSCLFRKGRAGRRAPGGVAEPLARVQGNGCSCVSGRGSRASSAIGWTPVRSQKIQDQKNTSQEPLMISAPFRRSFCLGLQAPLAHLCPPDPWPISPWRRMSNRKPLLVAF